MVYNVGQARHLYGIPQVVIPQYINQTLSTDQYPCRQNPVQEAVQIPLGTYDNNEIAYPQTVEKYEDNTQHKTAGEFSDFEIILLLVVVGIFIMSHH